MAEQHILPENDNDLKLARQVGKQLEEGMPVSDLQDPLIQQLLQYRRTVLDRHSTVKVDSAAIWSRISREPAPGKAIRHLHPQPSSRKWVWAAAASILIVISASLFYLFNTDRPRLIAESSSEQARIVLDDGSVVTLRPFSRVYLLESTRGETIYSLEGEGFFDVTSNPDRMFSVHAGNGRVHVLGTRFMLSSWGEMVQLFLEEGSVRFETADGSTSAILEPGQASSITGTNLQQPAPADAELFTDWLNNELTFSNRPARYVFFELEQHFGIDINAPDIVGETLIGGTLQLDSPASSLNDLGTVLGGNFTTTGNGQYTFTPDQNN